jgi:thiamine biosynthesis lipoprotein
VNRGCLLVCALVALACASPTPKPLATASDGRQAMGTVLELTLVGPDAGALADLLGALFAEAERLDALLTHWDSASDLGRLNASAGRGPRSVAPELADLLGRSRKLTLLTHGSFDVTVGPLVALWREAELRGELPSRAALAEALEHVGSEAILVGQDGHVALPEGSSVNLGGVAKGYALDRMLALLDRAGVEAALLSFGQSSTWALGAPPGASGWRLLARAPDGGFAGVLTLRDRALSVSESLGSFAGIAGRRFGHVLDPRSGLPLEREREALVVAPDATLAEALSKAVLVLGAREGLALVAALPGCEALLLDARGRAERTPGWDAAVSWQPLAPEM